MYCHIYPISVRGGYYYHHCLTNDTLLLFSGHRDTITVRKGAKASSLHCSVCTSQPRPVARVVETLEPGAEAVLWARLQAGQTEVMTPISLLAICQRSIKPICHHYLKRSLLYTR